ncbi:MAG: Hsp20/alpha crystallin family protein [Tissierellales bacterium]|nr:Hsp20/alpha crystallin family protein [Tissierellales bacterium]MBN2828397.1 Hsp20/alpha crystallin family protein [Tissierellales bacterium]
MANLVPFGKNKGLRPRGFEDFYDVLDDFFNDSWLTGRNPSYYGSFKVDVQDHENKYVVEAELPGVEKEEIDININDGRLSIAIKREENKEDKSKNYIHKERRFCSMERNIYLEDAKSEEIKAKLENGVLVVDVPKKEKEDRTRKIDIE